MMSLRIEEVGWRDALAHECTKPYFLILSNRVQAAYQTGIVYPPEALIYNALKQCPLNTVKVVIIGQDPYHGPGQANGLAFSVSSGVPIPPSLQNMYKEITADVGTPATTDGDLTPWAKQGVLLLNTTLTVAAGVPASHSSWGWQQFTDTIIKTINVTRGHAAFLLWGKHAQTKAVLIDPTKHLILTAPHPSPLSAHHGFFGCRHFSKTNDYLAHHNLTPITW